MPNYDYRCLNCKRRFSIFMVYADYGTKPVHCPHCESEQVQRRIGRVRIARSEDSRLEDFADPSNMDGLDEDPRTLGRMMRRMKNEVGEEMGPEFDEVVGRLEAGESPDEIEKAMPELNDEPGGADFGGEAF